MVKREEIQGRRPIGKRVPGINWGESPKESSGTRNWEGTDLNDISN